MVVTRIQTFKTMLNTVQNATNKHLISWVKVIQRNNVNVVSEMNFYTSQDELNFGWSDGKRLQFSNWAGSNEQLDDCVILDTDGFWKTADCDDNQPGAICYYPGSMWIATVSIPLPIRSSKTVSVWFCKLLFCIRGL